MKEFKNVVQRIEMARAELVSIQMQMRGQWTDSLQEQEKSIIQQIEKW